MAGERELRCPACGATQRPGDTCRDRFNRSLARELGHGAYGRVHHLTVAAFMVQHPQELSVRGWLATRRMLARFLREGTSPAAARALAGAGADRRWRITGSPHLDLPADFTWTMIIPDVAAEPPDVYTAAIIAWAQAVLDDALRLEV